MTKEATPTCWKCGAKDVSVKFAGYGQASCKMGCTLNHSHTVDIPKHELGCRVCGNQWVDGSGDFAVKQ